jgi:hypothetical protein
MSNGKSNTAVVAIVVGIVLLVLAVPCIIAVLFIGGMAAYSLQRHEQGREVMPVETMESKPSAESPPPVPAELQPEK